MAALVPDGELILYTDYCSMLEQVCMQLIVKHENMFFAVQIEWATESPKSLWNKITHEVKEYYNFKLDW